MRVLITGASGFLGTKLMQTLGKYDLVGAASSAKDNLIRMDFTDPRLFFPTIRRIKPNFIINTAAISSPKSCEKSPALAKAVNSEAVKYLVQAAQIHNAKLIQISTSYVFSGDSARGYKEADCTNGVNHYGRTKMQAEHYASAVPENLVFRVPLLYGFNGHGTDNKFLSIIEKSDDFAATEKQRGVLWTEDLSRVIEKSIEQDARGIFHVASDERPTTYQLALGLESVIRDNPHIVRPANEEDIELIDDKIPRPEYDFLDNNKVKNVLGFKFTAFDDAISEMRRQYQSEE